MGAEPYLVVLNFQTTLPPREPSGPSKEAPAFHYFHRAQNYGLLIPPVELPAIHHLLHRQPNYLSLTVSRPLPKPCILSDLGLTSSANAVATSAFLFPFSHCLPLEEAVLRLWTLSNTEHFSSRKALFSKIPSCEVISCQYYEREAWYGTPSQA